MSAKTAEPHELCGGCVFFPPSLPRQAYSDEDWEMLQARQCAFEHLPDSADCRLTRKTSCAVGERFASS